MTVYHGSRYQEYNCQVKGHRFTSRNENYKRQANYVALLLPFSANKKGQEEEGEELLTFLTYLKSRLGRKCIGRLKEEGALTSKNSLLGPMKRQ